MLLSELSAGVDALDGTTLGADPDILAITFDSRRVEPGSLFFAVVGESSDGHVFAEQAVAAGAVALVVERPLDLDVAQVVVANTRAAMAPIAATFYRHPSNDVHVIGITGTNGKTTCVSMVAAIVAAAGQQCHVIGTLTGARTTPEAPELQSQLADAAANGAQVVAMEVSSHALVQHRADSVAFDVGAFTNLSTDHLDYHNTMDEYFEAKARLFEPGRCATSVVWTDDPYGRQLADRVANADHGVVREVNESLVEIVSMSVAKSIFDWRGNQIELPMGGRFNIANAIVAAEACHAIGIGESHIVSGLASLEPVPGRFQIVDAGQPFGVVVDYSHTPVGLELAIEAARGVASGRVIVVFGAGGDRDRSKRPMMGAASERADLVVVTSDNPRSEDPDAIIAEIVAGMANAPWLVEGDRRDAIGAALVEAVEGDVVVIAGKGHETTQTIGDRVLDFDDRKVARQLIESMGAAS